MYVIARYLNPTLNLLCWGAYRRSEGSPAVSLCINEALSGLADKWNVYFGSTLHLTGMCERIGRTLFKFVKISLLL
jgi:hypothetical protein